MTPRTVLLMSGGVDSSALAALHRPALCLNVNYGQAQADTERRASRWIAQSLGLDWAGVAVDLTATSAGLMSEAGTRLEVSPTPEWWPFRNQFLITIAAAWAVTHDFDAVAIGTLSTDGDRHADGTTEFLEAMRTILELQEGGVSLLAPAITMTAAELLKASPLSDALLSVTHSCHRSSIACGRCPGCVKRRDLLIECGRLQ